MRANAKPAALFAAALGAGAAVLVLRRLLYALAVDARNLLVTDHPLHSAVWLLSAAAAVLLALGVFRCAGPLPARFVPSALAPVGHLAGALGIAFTCMYFEPVMPGYLGTAWHYAGLAAVICLALAGNRRRRGMQPFFLLYLIPGLFFMLHIINHYQTYSANPQLQDYLFALLGYMALMLHGLYCASFTVGLGKQRMLLLTALAACFFLTADLAATPYLLLNLGGIVWALLSTAGLAGPEPDAPEQPEAEEREEA